MTPTPRRKKRGTRSAVRETPVSYQRLLLDTHVWLWAKTNDRRLSAATFRVIAGAGEVYLSAASAWEIAIKIALRKLTIHADADIGAELTRDRMLELPVTIAHTEALRKLPALHRDPFDRLIVAQAVVEGLTIVTADPVFARYGIPVLNAAK